MTEEKKKILRNHIPTISRLCVVFLTCLDCPEELEETVESQYLLEILDKMKDQWQAAKDLLEE